MEDVKKFDIKVFDLVPDYLIDQVDDLLEDNESNNRINDNRLLSNYSKERYSSKKDRIKYIVTLDKQSFPSDKQKVVGIVIVFKREIRFKDRLIQLGGIGGVGTKMEYRGKGIATNMLKVAKRLLEEVVCDVAYLDTDINDPVMLKLYGKIEFIILGRNHTYLGKSGKRYYENDGMIAPIKSQEIFSEIMDDNKPFNIGQGNW